MEHEINKLIREKVRAAEGKPASWQKERVWQMIRIEKAPIPHRPLYYYVAASIVIILSVIFYRIQLENQKQLTLKIASLESAIIDKNKSGAQDDPGFNALKADETNCAEPNAQTSTATREIRSKQQQNVANDQPEIIPVVQDDRPEIAKVVINDDPVSDSVEIMSETTPVQAIIGFIPKSQDVAITSKVKKSRFKLFKNRNEEFITLPQEENKILTARIN